MIFDPRYDVLDGLRCAHCHEDEALLGDTLCADCREALDQDEDEDLFWAQWEEDLERFPELVTQLTEGA